MDKAWITTAILFNYVSYNTSLGYTSILWKKDVIARPYQSIEEQLYNHTVPSMRYCAMQCVLETCSMFEFNTNTNACSIFVGLKPSSGTEQFSEGSKTVYKRDLNCELSGYFQQREAGLCYKVFTAVKTWDQAVAECQNDEAILIMPNTVEKIEATIEIMKTYGETLIWIGLNDKSQEGLMQWTDGSVFNSSLWANTQFNDYDGGYPPNIYSADCITLKSENRYMVDSNCNQVRSYMCEKPHLSSSGVNL